MIQRQIYSQSSHSLTLQRIEENSIQTPTLNLLMFYFFEHSHTFCGGKT